MRVTPKRAVIGVLLLIAVVVGIPVLDSAACRYHEDREGKPVAPGGRVTALGEIHTSQVLALGRRGDASFDPSDVRYKSWRIVARVPSDEQPGTVLDVSECAPAAPWRAWPRRDYYLTVAR